MAEDRSTYTIKEDGGVGTVKIADEVVSIIACLAATEVKGVAAVADNITNELAARMGRKKLSKGARVEVVDDEVRVDLILTTEYGYEIPTVCREVQERVTNAIETMTGMKVAEVNVRIADVQVQDS